MNSASWARLQLFGSPSLTMEKGTTVTGGAVQRHRLALLAMLAVASGRGVNREKLVAYLWPESDQGHARNLLNVSVYVLRRALGEEAILSDREELRLNPGVVRTDVVEFEDALAAGDPARAVALCTGPFLDGFYVNDAPELERWVEQERARLAGMFAKALETLAEAAEREGDIGQAVEWWKARVVHDPYDSRVVLRLMHALDAAGSPAAALRHAAIHERLLLEEFGIEVPPEVRAAVDALRRHRNEPAAGDLARSEALPAPVDRGESGIASGDMEVGPDAPAEPRADDLSPRDEPEKDSGHPVRNGVGRRARRMAPLLAMVAVFWVFVSSRSEPAGSQSTSGVEGNASMAGSADVRPLRAIAVLPFANLSSDPEEEYFSDGLTDELIGTLSRMSALRVVARTSAFALKGEEQDIRRIGELLGVGFVLEGSVRRDGDRVRVSAQLVDASSGFQLWSDTYEDDGGDVFGIQSDIAVRIAAALEAELTPADRSRLARRPTRNAEAHAHYLKARYFWNRRTRGGFAAAIEHLERAIRADPQYGAAYALLASTYTLQGLSGELDPAQARVRVRAAALKALELDEELAEAHAALGTYLHVLGWDSEGAEREFLRAMELDPNYPYVRHSYGVLLAAMGRLEEAVEQKRKAVQLDPLAPQPGNSLGYTLLAAGRFEEAHAAFRDALELDSLNWRVHAGLGVLFGATGRHEESLREIRRAVALAGDATYPRAYYARALALSGRRDEARQLLGALVVEADSSGIHDPTVAVAFLALDDVAGALEWLERSYRQRHPQLRFIGGSASPGFERLEGDPRYEDLLRRVGLRG